MTKNLMRLVAFLGLLAMLAVGLVSPAYAHDANWDASTNAHKFPDNHQGPPAKALRCLTNPERPTNVALFVVPESAVGTRAADLDARNDKDVSRRNYLRQQIERSNAVFWRSSNGEQQQRWLTNDNCDAVITRVAVPDNVLTDSQGALFSYLISNPALGFNDDNRMYHLFTESRLPGPESAFAYNPGHDGEDDGLLTPFKHRNHSGNGGAANYVRYVNSEWSRNFNNGVPSWNGSIIAHESAHNMGAVSEASPDSDGYAHINEYLDIMSTGNARNECYRSINGDINEYLQSSNYAYLLDCAYNDYYAPPSRNLGSSNYLFDNWNIGNSSYLYGSSYPLKTATAKPVVPTITGTRTASGTGINLVLTNGEDTTTSGYVLYVQAIDGDGTPVGARVRKFVVNAAGLDTINGLPGPNSRAKVDITSVNGYGFTKASVVVGPPSGV